MTHPVIYSLSDPIALSSPYSIQMALEEIRYELEAVARGRRFGDTTEDRLARLEIFALLSEQHAANVHNGIK